MLQKEFANKVKKILSSEDSIVGVAVGGSWLTNEMDRYSDLDLILVTREKIGGDKDRMIGYAQRLEGFLSGFTGEHIGEPRLLICLYKNPLLHVDLKFLTLEEFHHRIETPIILLDRNGQLERAINNSQAKFPYPDYQWIEDRFWIWTHYALLKIGRGEYLEAYDFLGFLRMSVLGPLLHIKNGNLPRGVRKVETELSPESFIKLKGTLSNYDRQSLLGSLRNAVSLYEQLREELFDNHVVLQNGTKEGVMDYFDGIDP